MAAPARVKPDESTPERATSSGDESSKVKSEETEDKAATSPDENKGSSSQEPPKEDIKSVSSAAYLLSLIVFKI